MRSLHAPLVLIAIVAFVFTDGLAKPQPKAADKAATAGPVTVNLSNTCPQEVGLRIGADSFKVAAGGSTGVKTLAASANNAYEYTLEGSQRSPGYVFLAAGGNYTINIHGCDRGWANIATKNLAERPTGVSPNAAATIRFRSFRGKGERIANIEYRPGKRGRFKRLSVNFTPYVEAPGGDFPFGLKLKAGRRGPVLQMLNSAVKVEPGKKYLVEAAVVQGKLFMKFEDEGYQSK
jgi:hypothetical protein